RDGGVPLSGPSHLGRHGGDLAASFAEDGVAMKSTLISAEELAALPPDGVLIVDCRHELSDTQKGERDYRAEHIPGAVFADLDHDLSDLTRVPQGLGRHPLPTEAAFSAVLARWGWRPGLQVVSYDANTG